MLTEPQHATGVNDDGAADMSGDGLGQRRVERVVRSLRGQLRP